MKGRGCASLSNCCTCAVCVIGVDDIVISACVRCFCLATLRRKSGELQHVAQTRRVASRGLFFFYTIFGCTSCAQAASRSAKRATKLQRSTLTAVRGSLSRSDDECHSRVSAPRLRVRKPHWSRVPLDPKTRAVSTCAPTSGVLESCAPSRFARPLSIADLHPTVAPMTRAHTAHCVCASARPLQQRPHCCPRSATCTKGAHASPRREICTRMLLPHTPPPPTPGASPLPLASSEQTTRRALDGRPACSVPSAHYSCAPSQTLTCCTVYLPALCMYSTYRGRLREERCQEAPQASQSMATPRSLRSVAPRRTP